MYQSFEVSNFRCFRKLTLANAERVNLIAGMNNVGKTALLEALFLHCGAYNLELAMRVNAFRGIEMVKIEFARWAETPWDLLFHQFDTTKTIELVGKDKATGQRSIRMKVLHEPSELSKVAQTYYQRNVSVEVVNRLSANAASKPSYQRDVSTEESQATLSTSETVKVLALEYEEGNRCGTYYMILDLKGIHQEPIPPAPPFPAFFQGARMRIPFREEAERLRKLQIQGEEDVLLETLQLIEPRLSRLAIVLEAGEPILEGDIGIPGRRLVPLPLMGEGMVRLASLVLHISNAPNGVMLIDEIENGLHCSVLPKVWRAVGEVARRFNTQVFATTHSLECIVAAHKAFSESGIYDFRLHRLERVDETIRVVTYDQETLEAAIEMGLEVR